ncbi:MAG: helix-turn-helix transcriptional regulator [Lachnospiraceae bacterium]|nr:helix-turn-helix transcriptional regulator [Lachnospiraceae bacterium]
MGLEKINMYKKEKGITNKELSEITGIPKSTIDKITSGTNPNPQLETVKTIVYALGKTLGDLMDDEPVVDLFSYSSEIQEVTDAYKKADIEHKNIVRVTLGLELIDNQPKESNPVRFVARGGHVEMSEEEAAEMVRSSRNVPDQSGNEDLF